VLDPGVNARMREAYLDLGLLFARVVGNTATSS
jgi:hypothetical protein